MTIIDMDGDGDSTTSSSAVYFNNYLSFTGSS
jgi:hypothetical protein